MFEKSSNISFHENPSSGSRVVACEITDRQTDMTKTIAAFRNSRKAPKNEALYLAGDGVSLYSAGLWFYAHYVM
jgi:hypothetical protein